MKFSGTQDSTHKGVNQRSKDATQTQQQRPESPTVTLTWHASKHKIHTLHQLLSATQVSVVVFVGRLSSAN